MLKIDTTAALFAPEKAEAIAAEWNAADPDWTYAADHDPKGTGYSRVTIHDEEGEFVAFMTRIPA